MSAERLGQPAATKAWWRLQLAMGRAIQALESAGPLAMNGGFGSRRSVIHGHRRVERGALDALEARGHVIVTREAGGVVTWAAVPAFERQREAVRRLGLFLGEAAP